MLDAETMKLELELLMVEDARVVTERSREGSGLEKDMNIEVELAGGTPEDEARLDPSTPTSMLQEA